MWVSRSLDSVSSRARAIFGKFREVIAGSTDDECTTQACLPQGEPRGLDAEEFESISIDVGTSKPVNIFVSRTPEALYFEHSEPFKPTIVGAVKSDTSVEDIVEPVSKREKVFAGEPADLFINALRKPVRQKFDSATPVFKKKVVEAPVSMPVEEDVKPVIEQITFSDETVAEESTTTMIVPEVSAEEVETVIDSFVIEEPAAEVFEAEPEVIEAVPEAEAFPEVIEAAPAVEEDIVFHIPEVEEEPYTGPAVMEAEPEVIEAAPVEEEMVFSIPEVEEEPYTAAPVVEEEFDMSLYETLEADDSLVEHELRHEVPAIEDISVFSIPETEKAYSAAMDVAPVEEEMVFSIPEVEEEPYTAAPVVEEESFEAPAAAAPARFEIGDESFDLAFIDSECEAAPEQIAVAEPTFALPSPKTVVRSLPAKIELPALEAAKTQDEEMTASYAGMEMAETSSAVAEPVVSNEITMAEVTAVPPVIVNEDRDVLFAFRSDLEADEAEFVSTSYDDNLAFREDYLDQTEGVFKFRAKVPTYRFDGNLRSLYTY